MDLTYCVVNTNGGELLGACLDAIEATHPPGLRHEVIVLDNASDDDSPEHARGRSGVRLIERDRRAGKAENDTIAMREARGELCLLLNEDSELMPGATAALAEALERDERAAVAGAQLLDPEGNPQPCAWRLPGIGTALAQATLLHRRLVVQSGGEEVREVGWVQSAAMLVRRDRALEVGWLDPEFFVYSDETDLQKRLTDAGWTILHVPRARAVHHEQLATDASGSARRIVEFHRNRDLYVRKHHGRPAALLVRLLSALPYALRALGALAHPRHSARLQWLHARRALRPSHGEGLREAAAEHNARLIGPGAPRSGGGPAR